MPRASWPALLMVAVLAVTCARAAEQAAALARLNPWLSACDLVGGSEDLRGECSVRYSTPLPRPSTGIRQAVHMEPCPAACGADSDNTTQCLEYLDEAHKATLCGDGPWERRRRALERLRLRHCCEHGAASALRPHELRLLRQGGPPCRHTLHALLQVDALARRLSCEFAELLTRYDCAQSYSIVHHCDDCKEAYRRWVCSSLVPLLTTGGRVRPCRSVCHEVEQRCPYLLPGDRAPALPTQYAGEPTFLCLDPNIPETGLQRERSAHGDNQCCYTYCGGPGRPACVQCPRPRNNSWEVPACGSSSPHGTNRCQDIAKARGRSAPSSPAPLLLLLLLLHLALNTDSLHVLCCVCRRRQCARTTPAPAWTS